MLEILQLAALSDNYIYLLHEAISGKTAVIDPALAEPVITALDEHSWQLDYIFNTHHHSDHIGGNMALKQQTGCKIVGAKSDRHRIPGIDIEVMHGDQIQFGNQTINITATPGHTNGHIAYYSPDSEALFCGDTLFSLGCGRLFEGSAEQMWQSLQIFKALPLSTKVYCAHEYTLANGRFALTLEADNIALQQRMTEATQLRSQNLSTIPTTIGLELATNPFFRENSASIRQALRVDIQESASSVFARIRLLKDQFR